MSIEWETTSFNSKCGRFCVHLNPFTIRKNKWLLADYCSDGPDRHFESAELAKQQAEAILQREQLTGLYVSPEAMKDILAWGVGDAVLDNASPEARAAFSKEW